MGNCQNYGPFLGPLNAGIQQSKSKTPAAVQLGRLALYCLVSTPILCARVRYVAFCSHTNVPAKK